ncbi:MAG: cell wall-active antibiotics response protein [Cytophagaceae bacterium]|nr:cell wall-active antibiotics response protein [Cytophagaceae bacterium]
MNSRNLLTGAILIGIGILFLGRNIGWFDFDWGQLARFWPLLVILLGITLLFGQRSRPLTVATVLLLAIAIPIAIVHRERGGLDHAGFFDNDQHWDFDHDEYDYDKRDDEATSDTTQTESRTGRNLTGGAQQFTEPMDATLQRASFRLEGGAAHFDIGGTSSQLVQASTDLDFGRYSLQKVLKDDGQGADLTFSMKGNKKMEWKNGDFRNRVNVSLNATPLWDIHAEIGAGEADFDLSPYRVRTMTLETGVTDIDVKFGDRADLTEVDVDAGVAHVRLRVPKSVGCRIDHEGLSVKDFDDFQKVGNYYQSAGYDQATKKINIKFDSGLSKLDVERY